MSITDFNMMKLGEVIALLMTAMESTHKSIFEMAELAQLVMDEGALDQHMAKLFFDRLQDLASNSNKIMDSTRSLTTPLLTILEVDPNNLSTTSNQ